MGHGGARRLVWQLGVGLFFLLAGCTSEVHPPSYSFYHWETQLKVNDSLLHAHQADRLYIKAFDVSWEQGRAEPAAVLQTSDNTLAVVAVPIIFITNEVFQHPADTLAEDITALLDRSFPYPFAELQLDCDWTAGTRIAYFDFLTHLRELLPGKTISCTVRLHQYRDRAVQGVPPVDRAVLMAYNTGELGRWETDNSIVDPRIISAYVKDQPPYPLPLDLAVAVYDWAAVYRRGQLAYLINEPDLAELADTARFAALGPLRYQVERSTYYGGLYLYRGDLIRREVAGRDAALRLADGLWPQIAGVKSERIIFYRMGSRQWAD